MRTPIFRIWKGSEVGGERPGRGCAKQAFGSRKTRPGFPARLQGTLSKLTLSATDQRVYGGSRLHLRDDWPRTPSGPEGSSGRGFKSGAEVLLARAASYSAPES
jgi:hypothetical protein